MTKCLDGVLVDEGTANAALRESVALLPEGAVKTTIESDLEGYSVRLNKCVTKGKALLSTQKV